MPGAFKGPTVPIKVRIGLRPNGHADHPDWSLLPMVGANDETQWMAGGWIYDKSSGHDTESPHSPLGEQIGILFVSEAFAAQAVTQFPNITKITDETELETFINQNCTAHIPDFRMDNDYLQSLNTEHELLTKLGQSTAEVEARIAKALNPDDPSPGKKHQPGRDYAAIKSERAITLSDQVTPKP